MTVVIDGTNGISGVDGTASNPVYEGTDALSLTNFLRRREHDYD
jgi:hypothetical protein